VISITDNNCKSLPRLALFGTWMARKYIQEGLAVARIARDDPSTLPDEDHFPRAHIVQ